MTKALLHTPGHEPTRVVVPELMEQAQMIQFGGMFWVYADRDTKTGLPVYKQASYVRAVLDKEK